MKDEVAGMVDLVAEVVANVHQLSTVELFDKLGELWIKGYGAGRNDMETIVKQIGNELSKIVAAHVTGDQTRLKQALDELVAKHVIVVDKTTKAH
jgi:hypothetical protein